MLFNLLQQVEHQKEVKTAVEGITAVAFAILDGGEQPVLVQHHDGGEKSLLLFTTIELARTFPVEGRLGLGRGQQIQYWLEQADVDGVANVLVVYGYRHGQWFAAETPIKDFVGFHFPIESAAV